MQVSDHLPNRRDLAVPELQCESLLSAGINIGGCGYNAKTNLSVVVRGNAVSSAAEWGLGSGGYCMHGDSFANNTVHSTTLGWSVKGNIQSNLTSGRGILGRGIVMWGLSDMAFWLYTTSKNPIVGGALVADANIGVLWSNIGPGPVDHTLEPNVVTIQDSVFIGRSYSNPGCSKRTALMMPVSTSAGPSISPGVCGDLGGPHRAGIWGPARGGGSYPSLLAETRLHRNTFLRYEPDACGTANVLETLMEGGQNAADGVPPVFATQTTIDEVSRNNLALLKNPRKEWIIPAKCGVMDCGEMTAPS